MIKFSTFITMSMQSIVVEHHSAVQEVVGSIPRRLTQCFLQMLEKKFLHFFVFLSILLCITIIQLLEDKFTVPVLWNTVVDTTYQLSQQQQKICSNKAMTSIYQHFNTCSDFENIVVENFSQQQGKKVYFQISYRCENCKLYVHF